MDKYLASCGLLTSEVSKVKAILRSFADDTDYIVAAKTEKELPNLLKSGVLYIKKWMRLNKLKLNHKKSSLLIYGRSRNYFPWIEQIQLSGNIILPTKSVKFLGVVLDECLNFMNHVVTFLPKSLLASE